MNNNKILKRKNLKIPEYNYSNDDFYFITICTKGRKCILSKIINDEKIILINWNCYYMVK